VTLLLRGGRVVDPQTDTDEVADVLVEGDAISSIGTELEAPSGATVVECAGKVVLPGFVDVHTHLREPGREDEETIASGTRAAAHGGFTAVCAMPNTSPVCDTGSAVRFVIERAEEAGSVRVWPVGSLTTGQSGEAIAEMGDMIAEGAVAFSDDGRDVQDTGMMRRVMDYARTFDTTVIAHCEDEALVGKGVVNEGVISTRLGLAGWPAAAEETMVARNIRLAELTGCRLHLAHVSTAGSAKLIAEAKQRGVAVTAEVTPHHLFLDEEALTSYDTNLKMNPPLRTAEDAAALREALAAGVIDCIATDHAPHAPHEKEMEFELAPFGTTGLETALSLMVTHLVDSGDLSWGDVARVMAIAPRRAVNLPEVRLEAGSVADITVVDPEARVEVTADWFLSKSRNSAFLGHKLLGKASEVVVGGRLVSRNGKVIDS
jgi:dihydroorotase